MKRTGRRKEGFTLIEVVVSIAILGLVSIPFCNSLMFGYRYATNADSLLNSHLEATSIVEELMADGISVTEYTDDTSTKIAVNDIVIDTSDTTTNKNYSASISSSDDGSYTITCYNSDQTYGYSASFDSPADFSTADNNTVSIKYIYSCTYTDSDEEESYDGICFLISDSNEGDTDVTAYTFIMNFNWEFTEVTEYEDDDGNMKMEVEEDDDVLTLVFAPNSEYPAAEQDSTGSGSTGSGSTGSGSTESDSTDEGPYWYDVAVSQGNVSINTSIRLADQDEDTGDEGISVTITDAGGNTTASGTYYASSNIFIPSDSSTSYTAAESDDGTTVTLTDSEENSTEYDVTANDDGSQTWTAKSS